MLKLVTFNVQNGSLTLVDSSHGKQIIELKVFRKEKVFNLASILYQNKDFLLIFNIYVFKAFPIWVI